LVACKTQNSSVMIECEVLAGLKPFVVDEVRRVLGHQAELVADDDPTALRFGYSGQLSALLRLRTAVAAYLLVTVPGRRPSALLGDTTLFDQVEAVRRLHPPGAFSSFRLSAPGKESAALRRLREELTRRSGLAYDPEDGELLLRIRRAPAGWDLLTRLSPRPLSTRPWRVHNLPGALNATIAAAAVDMTRPRGGDRVLNLMCGSGTLLIERFARGRPALALGCDIDPSALAGTRGNLAAAGLTGSVGLAQTDVTALCFADATFDVLLADLPYGHRMGSHQDNAALYPAVLQEAARVAAPGAALLVVTHELRLFERCLATADRWWSVERAVQVYQKGHHPMVYLLRRTPMAAGKALRHDDASHRAVQATGRSGNGGRTGGAGLRGADRRSLARGGVLPPSREVHRPGERE
jgi:ubiquinone/menaquinone biosynthesis C-methylase UbiE